MRANEPWASNSGFTLIEVIISFIILATVLGSVTASLSYSAKLHRASEAKMVAEACAERIIAEKFGRKAGLPATESGAVSETCRWHISRRVVKSEFTESQRSLVSFRLEVLGPQDQIQDAFDSYYVESSP